MEQPQGFSDGNPNSVLKLLKALYGTKQAGRCWDIEFTDFLVSLGFNQCRFDPCLFILVDGDNSILLVLYMDDVLAISNDQQLVDTVLQQIEEKFQLPYLVFPSGFCS